MHWGAHPATMDSAMPWSQKALVKPRALQSKTKDRNMERGLVCVCGGGGCRGEEKGIRGVRG